MNIEAKLNVKLMSWTLAINIFAANNGNDVKHAVEYVNNNMNDVATRATFINSINWRH